jgi:hypothetical protein
MRIGGTMTLFILSSASTSHHAGLRFAGQYGACAQPRLSSWPSGSDSASRLLVRNSSSLSALALTRRLISSTSSSFFTFGSDDEPGGEMRSFATRKTIA